MHISASALLSWLLALHLTTATTHRPGSPPNNPHLASHQKLPQRPISFSSPSQHPLFHDLPSSDGAVPLRGTINVSSCGPDQPIPVTFSLSPLVCVPMISELPYIMADLSQKLLSEHLDGFLFPSSSEPLPIYLAANITEHIYRSKYVLGVSLKLTPLRAGLKSVKTSRWRSIMALLEQAVLEMDRAARKRNGEGLGSVLVVEGEMAEIEIRAEWRLWSIIDGLAVICNR